MKASEAHRVSAAPIRTLEQAAGYLEGLINMERVPALGGAAAGRRLGLGPIRRLLERVGNPEKGLSILHVAGSKGKGSVCLLAEHVLCATGERVGTFTSPHLSSWAERFRIDGAPVQGEELARAVERLRPHVDELRARDPHDAPTFFDATTAAALLVFAGAGVDRAILEVGLGGRLDSTNAVAPAATCVTQIELEHTEILGDTIAAIAAEKAGILKPGAPCVVGWLDPDALAVVRERAAAIGAPLFEAGEDFELVSAEPDAEGLGCAFEYRESDGFVVAARLQLAGAHQARNAALALACVRRLPRASRRRATRRGGRRRLPQSAAARPRRGARAFTLAGGGRRAHCRLGARAAGRPDCAAGRATPPGALGLRRQGPRRLAGGPAALARKRDHDARGRAPLARSRRARR